MKLSDLATILGRGGFAGVAILSAWTATVAADPAAELSVDELRKTILETRGGPLTNLDVRASVAVRDFGAIPDDGLDDRPGIAAAVAKARTMDAPVQICFEPGRYDIQAATKEFTYTQIENAAISLSNCRDLLIDGAGAELLIHRQDVSAFALRNSTNLIFRNFTVDYDPLPFFQGTVESVDQAEDRFVMVLHDGFPRPDDAFFKSCSSWGVIKDREVVGRLKLGAPSFFPYESITPIDEKRFSVKMGSPSRIEHIDAGDLVAFVGRSASIGSYRDSENVTFDHITAYACPGPVFIGEEMSRLGVLNCRVVLKDNRLLSNGGGGVICQASRIGPWVENCEFQGLSDDCMNLYGLPIYILEQISPTELRVYAKAGIQSGDPLAFFNPNEGRVIQETTVVSFSGDRLVVKDPLEKMSIVPPGTKLTGRNPRHWKIYDHAYNLSAVGNYFVYRNNYMHDGRRYGALIRSSYGLIESNRLVGLSHAGIKIHNEPDWPEGFWARNVIVRGNQVIGCGYASFPPCIGISSEKLGGPTVTPLQKNIFVVDNVFRAETAPVAEFIGIDGLVLEGNVFESKTKDGPLVEGKGVTSLKVSGNAGESRIHFE